MTKFMKGARHLVLFQMDVSSEDKRKEKQKELTKQMNDEARARLARAKDQPSQARYYRNFIFFNQFNFSFVCRLMKIRA